VIDAEERKIGIKKYLLVNPPLDLSYAVKKYPYGGHLGNLRYSDNKEYVLRYFSAEHDRRSGSVDADELAEDARLPQVPGL
jgi:hypothetical protein